MGSRTNRYREVVGGPILRGICAKTVALDVQTGQKVLLKSGRMPDWGGTKDEYRTAVLARECGVPVVVGTWTRSDLVRGDVTPTYVVELIDGAYAVEGERNWSHQQQVDFLHIMAFAHIVGEGDRHPGNMLIAGDRMLGIDFAYPGYNTGNDFHMTVRMLDVKLPDVTIRDIKDIASTLKANRKAIHKFADRLGIDGVGGRLHTITRTLTNYVRDHR